MRIVLCSTWPSGAALLIILSQQLLRTKRSRSPSRVSTPTQWKRSCISPGWEEPPGRGTYERRTRAKSRRALAMLLSSQAQPKAGKETAMHAYSLGTTVFQTCQEALVSHRLCMEQRFFVTPGCMRSQAAAEIPSAVIRLLTARGAMQSP